MAQRNKPSQIISKTEPMSKIRFDKANKAPWIRTTTIKRGGSSIWPLCGPRDQYSGLPEEANRCLPAGMSRRKPMGKEIISKTFVHHQKGTLANRVEHSTKPYQKPPGKKHSDADHKAEDKEKAKNIQQKRDNKAVNLRRMTPGSNPPEPEVEDQCPQDRVEDTPRSTCPLKPQGKEVTSSTKKMYTRMPMSKQLAIRIHSSQKLLHPTIHTPHHKETNASDSKGSQCQLSPSPVYVPAAHLEQLMGKLQADLKKDFNNKMAELEKQKQKDQELFQERERALNERLKATRSELQGERDFQECAPGFSGPQEYKELLRLHAEISRRRSELSPTPGPGKTGANPEHGVEDGPQDDEDEMDKDIGLIIPEGSTPLPSTPIDLTTCPPFHQMKDIVFEGVDATKVEWYLDQENTLFLVCFLGCNMLLRGQNTGPNVLMGLRWERYDVDMSNMTITAAAPQLIKRRGHAQLPSPGQPPHTLVLSDVPPKLEKLIRSKHIFIYSPEMAFIALSGKDILEPHEMFMGMMHARNSSNTIRHNDPTNASLHRNMMVAALSYNQPVHDAIVHLFHCKQNEVNMCMMENIDTLVLRPTQASVKVKNTLPTIGLPMAKNRWLPRTKGRHNLWQERQKPYSNKDQGIPAGCGQGMQVGLVRSQFKQAQLLPQHTWVNLLMPRASVLGGQETHMFCDPATGLSSSLAGGEVDFSVSSPAEDSRRLNRDCISPPRVELQATPATAMGNTSPLGTNVLDPRGIQQWDLQEPTTDLTHSNLTMPSATAQGSPQSSVALDQSLNQRENDPPPPRVIF
ncbi:hypothetical protein EDD18DRAFT_1110240 [Armillaria luteobubalina]|uniref:Uncharacterized protein n=1 Tax=Armillaria luteobubalina TaxID=153913 RepID=A0AA39PQB5_9AGAR|nr:hypothetical protein EDD18DRAFT_1110240 [Armillaria luteobubalina]